MAPYWLLFAYFAAGTFLAGGGGGPRTLTYRPFLLIGALLMTLLIGLRYEVGGDWYAYEDIFRSAQYYSLGEALGRGDPGFQLINWLVERSGAGIWLVNTICAAIFTWGLLKLSARQPEPWLAVLVAVPYLVIVVAMGYTRQAVAIGILMAGLAQLQRGASILRFTFYVAIAALFHKTAVMALLLVALTGGRRGTTVNLLIAIAASILFYNVFLEASVERLVRNYIEEKYSSQGAAIRVLMCVIPASLFLLRRKAFDFSPHEENIWRNFSYAALALLLLLFVVPSSTAIDRLALYVLPLQMIVFSRVPGRLIGHSFGRLYLIAYCAAVQFVWLNYANHAELWLPYRLYPIG